MQAPFDSEDLWVTLEPFVEQHLEDREVRQREEQRQQMEDAMAKSRERRNQQLTKQLGLNPFQAEQLAKLRDEFQARRREAMMPEEGQGFDPKRLPENSRRKSECVWPASSHRIRLSNITIVPHGLFKS